MEVDEEPQEEEKPVDESSQNRLYKDEMPTGLQAAEPLEPEEREVVPVEEPEDEEPEPVEEAKEEPKAMDLSESADLDEDSKE